MQKLHKGREESEGDGGKGGVEVRPGGKKR